MQQQSTTSTEGVEVLENRPFEEDVLGQGRYTSKIYRLQSKAPAWLTTFAPVDALVMQEEAWNAYPRCKTVIKCPYFTKFSLTVETVHKADNGISENKLGKPASASDEDRGSQRYSFDTEDKYSKRSQISSEQHGIALAVQEGI